MGLFGASSDRDALLPLESRIARLEEQVARLTADLASRSGTPDAVPPEAEPAVSLEPASVDDGYAEARALAAEGNKIHAIKLVQDQRGISLRAAKDLVESW